MTFKDTLNTFSDFDFNEFFKSVSSKAVSKSLNKETLDPEDLLNLLSDKAGSFLEKMARTANALTLRHFGRTISLFAPLYISDHCTNRCTYCGFNDQAMFSRTRLTMEEIETQARAVAGTGIRHILVLTGEAPKKTPLSYLENAIRVLKPFFASIGLEIFPMDEQGYKELIKAGADSLTIYQEVYDRAIYRQVHLKGKKTDYDYRLSAPQRGAKAGFRAVTIGPLFGLGPPRIEAFMAAMHARYLEKRFPDVEISLSLPRMKQVPGGIPPGHILTDKGFVQIMLAWRLFMPRAGICISTRESPEFRDRLIHLGATRFSAGSRTGVGGYTLAGNTSQNQFEVTDNRPVADICAMIQKNGFDPVFKDWQAV